MKLGVSNLAWTVSREPSVLGELERLHVTELEVAPTKVWDRPERVSEREAARYRRRVAGHGLTISAIQSLVHGRPDLSLFADAGSRRRASGHLKRVLDLGVALGARAAIIGAPAFRRRGDLSLETATALAHEFFSELSLFLAGSGLVLCIEPLPEALGCDFLNTAAEVARFSGGLPPEGIGLHLDAASLWMNREAPAEAVAAAGDRLHHVHASEEGLGLFGSSPVNHLELCQALREAHYEGVVSLEMIATQGSFDLQDIRASVRRAQAVYVG